MKRFKNVAAAGLIGALVLTSAGCTGTEIQGQNPSVTSVPSVSETIAETETSASDTSASDTSASESSASETEAGSTAWATETPVSTHEVSVTDLSVTTITNDTGYEVTVIIPKLIVDGVEAESVNEALKDHINKEHAPKQETGADGETIYMDGENTRYAWGVRGNIVSIVIIASETFTDGVRYEVFNYNADTLQAAGNDEVIKSFGITEDEFYGRVADAYTAWWDGTEWLKDADRSSLDESINAISSKAVPFVTPDGGAGALGLILNLPYSQFPEMTMGFDLDTLEREYFTAK